MARLASRLVNEGVKMRGWPACDLVSRYMKVRC